MPVGAAPRLLVPMSKPLQYALVVCLLAVTGASIWGGIGLNRHAIAALDAWGKAAPNVQPTLTKANATLDAINAPCVGFHGSVTCGPLAQLSQTEKNVGILAGKSAQQVQQTGVLVTAVAQNLDTVGDSVKKVAGRLSVAADAATGTLNEATVTIAAGKPLLASLTRNSDDINSLIKENAPSLHLTLENVQGMTASGNGILADGKLVADKSAADFTKAHTPFGKLTTRLWGGYDILAWVAGHRP